MLSTWMPSAPEVSGRSITPLSFGSRASPGAPYFISGPALSAQQQAVESPLVRFLTGGATPAPIASYPGPFTAGPSPFEQAALSNLWATMSGTSPQAQALSSLLSGASTYQPLTPEREQELWQKSVVEPMTGAWADYILPELAESYVGSGTFMGGPRLEAERRSGVDLARMLAEKRLGMAQWGEAMRAQAAQRGLSALSAAQSGLAQQFQLGALPRMLMQANLNAQLQDYWRTHPEIGQLVPWMLQYLGLPTMWMAGVPQVINTDQMAMLSQLLQGQAPQIEGMPQATPQAAPAPPQQAGTPIELPWPQGLFNFPSPGGY